MQQDIRHSNLTCKFEERIDYNFLSKKILIFLNRESLFKKKNETNTSLIAVCDNFHSINDLRNKTRW